MQEKTPRDTVRNSGQNLVDWRIEKKFKKRGKGEKAILNNS